MPSTPARFGATSRCQVTCSSAYGLTADARSVSRTTRQEFALPRLDPRKPLVLDTHELERRPGTMRTISRCVPAPTDLATEVIWVPAGDDLELDLRLESVLEGILVTGTASALAVGECARCLERLERTLVVDLQELFAYPEHAGSGHAGTDGVATDVAVVEGDLIDLEPTVRDAVVLALPLAPVCRDDCRGLCPECGALLVAEPDHAHDQIDPRWAALQAYGTTTDGEPKDIGAADSDTTDGHPTVTTNNDRPRAGELEES